MRKTLKELLVIVLAIMAFIPFVRVNATTITGKPKIVTKLKSSGNGVYSYDIGLDFKDWLIPAQSEDETPYCLIDGWELYEKVGSEYKKLYSTDSSDPDFESLYSIKIQEKESKAFAVRVFTEDYDTGAKSYSSYSDATTLDHRVFTTIVAKVAHGSGCFNITGEGLNGKVCDTDTGNKTFKVPSGTKVTVKASPAKNFGFDGWYVFDAETGQISVVVQSTNVEYSFTADETVGEYIDTIAAAFIRTSYTVIEGAKQTYIVDNNKEAKFRIDADYSLFEDGGKVLVDEKEINSKNYTAKEGSTIITLKQEYVDTLSEGEHKLQVVFNDNSSATTSFNIEKNSSKEETPTNSNTEEKPIEETKIDKNKESETKTNTNNNTEKKPETKTETATNKETKSNTNTKTNTNKNTTKTNTSKASSRTGKNNPQTGDNVLTYIELFILSTIGLGGTIIVSKKIFN